MIWAWRMMLVNAWDTAVETWRDYRAQKALDKKQARCAEFPGHYWVPEQGVLSHVHSDGRTIWAHRCSSCDAIEWRELNESQ